jgi:hypothetical protein
MMQLQRSAAGQVCTSLLLLLLPFVVKHGPMPADSDPHWSYAEARHQQPRQQDNMQAGVRQAEAKQATWCEGTAQLQYQRACCSMTLYSAW